MNEITQEYLDKKFENLLFEIGKRMGSMETGLEARLEAKFSAKIDTKIDALREELKSFVTQGFESHQTWVREEFKEWVKPYDVRNRVTKVESDVADLKLRKKALA
jgi:hypothetical protein